MEIKKALRELAEARRALGLFKAQQAKAKAAMEATPEGVAYALVQALYKEGKLEEGIADQHVRELALALHDYGEPLPDGVQTKQVKVVVDRKQGVEGWARTNLPGVFEFSRKKWEAAVKAGLVPDDVARIEERPKIYIDRDLSRLLEVQGDDES